MVCCLASSHGNSLSCVPALPSVLHVERNHTLSVQTSTHGQEESGESVSGQVTVVIHRGVHTDSSTSPCSFWTQDSCLVVASRRVEIGEKFCMLFSMPVPAVLVCWVRSSLTSSISCQICPVTECSPLTHGGTICVCSLVHGNWRKTEFCVVKRTQ